MKLDGLLFRTIGAVRLLHSSSALNAVAAAAPLNKSSLAQLRKRTGYTFSNCKKALEQFGDDLPKAEAWLREQAQKEGWAKATKLQGRTAAQGLVGIAVKPEDGLGVLVEVNCETDFVARNGKFQELVSNIADACSRELDMKPIDGSSYHKWSLTPERISSFKWTQGRTLGDMTALAIGQLGENIVLRRAVLVKANTRECRISGYAHSADVSPPGSSCCLLGRYGAVVVYRESGKSSDPISSPLHLDAVGRQLCQHVVGMNPQSIGSLDDPPQRPQPAVPAPVVQATEGEVEDESHIVRTPSVAHEDESRLIHQEYLADPTMTVGDLLLQNGVEVLDFVRFECGGAPTEET